MSNWYVIHVRTGCEPDVKRELIRRGYDAAVPTEAKQERRGGRWTVHERLLIPSYVFVQAALTDADYYTVREIPGVIRFLSADGRPAALPDNEAAYIRWLANDGKTLQASDVYADGTDVTVASGPLMGREGSILSINRRTRRATVAIAFAGHRQIVKMAINVLTPTVKI